MDALESLRNQAHPKESHVDRRYEILQRFIEGVRNQNLRESLSAMYAHEDYLENPPTVEEIRFATQQYLRTRGSYREKAPFIPNNQNRQPLQPLQQRQVPQPHVMPPPANNPAPAQNPAPHQCWFNPCPVNESRNPPTRRRRTRTPSTTDRALHANSTVTSQETAPTGMAPNCFGKATNKSIR